MTTHLFVAALLLATQGLVGCGDSDSSHVDRIQNPGAGGQAGSGGSAGSSPQAGAAGQPDVRPPSCRGQTPGADLSCGSPAEDDCCASLAVPGGSFLLDYDGVVHLEASRPATVASFRLDKYEVTVGRFRAFLEALPDSRPAVGAGAHPWVPGSGWQESWPLVVAKEEFSAQALAYNESQPEELGHCLWSDQPGEWEHHPIMCLSWYELFAFCAWDGGRLLGSAEWYYAGAGGQQQRVYPWSVPPSSRDTQEALPGISFGSYSGLLPVGTFPKSHGRWGHADLLGNASEFVLDTAMFKDPLTYPCTGCVVLGGPGEDKVIRDFGWGGGPATAVAAVGRVNYDFRSPGLGGRCARKP